MGIDLDSKENDLIAEYAAGVMLMHSHYYDDRYDKPWIYDTETETEEATVDEPATEEPSTENPTAENATSENTTSENTTSGTTDNPTSDGSVKPSGDGNSTGGETSAEEPEVLDLTKAFGTHPVEVNYVDFVVCDSYDVDPEGFFEIVPDEGCSFLVLNFTLNNRSFVKQTVNTSGEDVIIRLTVNDKNKYNNYDASMLLNDLTVLSDITLESREVYNTVILYMIPTEVADNVDTMYIEVASDIENKGTLVLK